MLLQSFDKATEYLDFSSKKTFYSKDEKTVGWFKYVNDNLSALYSNNGKMFYQYGRDVWELTGLHSSSIGKLQGDKKKFRLFHDGILEHEFVYIFFDDFLNVEPFEYIEIEDFDWGLFLMEIVNNEDRKYRIINGVN